jgi:acyl-CoA reductase-like NAD-dependent aldehyde dehydrogenase
MTAPLYSPAMLIGGSEFRPDRKRRTYRSPATGESVTEILLGTPEDVDKAVAAATGALADLAALSLDERARRCEDTARALEENADPLARVITREHGKPLHSEALGEVRASAEAFRQAGAQARWLPVSHYPLSTSGKRLLALRRPRGVYGVVTPWNFPIGTAAMYYLGPGLAAGNSIVWVGAPSTNAAHWEFARIVASHWPEGALNLVTGDGAIVGQAVVGHPHVDAVGFTGSTPVGLQVARAAAGKACMLELGGNGPTLVLEDTDVELAAERIAGGSFTNAGQICTSTGRILAHERVASALAEAIAGQAASIILGDPEDEKTTMGPVHLASLAERVLGQVEGAAAAGANVVTGGRRVADAPTGQYLEPTVVDRVPPEADLHREESFGPVAPVVHFSSEAEMWRLVAASPYGLFGAVFSRDVERALGIAERLRCGHVNVNDTSAYWEISIPAGGAAGAASGTGRTGGPWSVAEMTEVLTVTVDSKVGHPEMGGRSRAAI